MKKITKKTIIAAILMLLILSISFGYSVKIRSPWFGKLSEGHHQWLTGSTLIFTKNWHREGAIKNYFAMYPNPNSIETPQKRDIYSSYPPGSVIPIYIVSKILNTQPSLKLIMTYNLVNHFLITLLLIATIFIFLRKIGLSLFYTFIFSLIPIATELFLPAPMYWHQNVFFSDQAVILPFIFFIFLEVLRTPSQKSQNSEKASNKYIASKTDIQNNIETKSRTKTSRIIKVLQSITFFIGMFTDWFFFFVALAIYIKRILNKEIPSPTPLKKFKNFFIKSLNFWLPGIIAILIFMLQILITGRLKELIEIFLFRTAIDSSGKEYVVNFFEQFGRWMNFGYGKVAIASILLSTLIFTITAIILIHKKIKKSPINPTTNKIFTLIGITLIPCIIQVLCFQNHSVIHDFSILKFSIPLAIGPFTLIPFLILSLFNIDISKLSISPKKRSDLNSRFMGFTAILLVFILIFIADKHPDYRRQGYFPPSQPNFIRIENDFNTAQIGYKDIIFSPDFDIPTYPPQLLSLTMKRVYKVNSMEEIQSQILDFKNEKAKLADSNSEYRIILALINPPNQVTIAKYNLDKAKQIPGTNFIKFFVLETNPN